MKLPTFIIADEYTSALGDDPTEHKVIELQCPRKGCGEIFIARRKGFGKLDSLTRPCPYCFRTSVLPETIESYVRHRARMRWTKTKK